MTIRSNNRAENALLIFLFLILPATATTTAQTAAPEEIKVDWRKIERVSQTTLSLQAVVTLP